MDFPFLATALSILLTMVPLLPPKLVCLPWTFALVLSYRTFVPILPGLDFIWVRPQASPLDLNWGSVSFSMIGL